MSLGCFSPETLFGQQPNRAESGPFPCGPDANAPQRWAMRAVLSSARSNCRRRGVEIGIWSDILLVPEPAPHLLLPGCCCCLGSVGGFPGVAGPRGCRRCIPADGAAVFPNGGLVGGHGQLEPCYRILGILMLDSGPRAVMAACSRVPSECVSLF